MKRKAKERFWVTNIIFENKFTNWKSPEEIWLQFLNYTEKNNFSMDFLEELKEINI